MLAAATEPGTGTGASDDPASLAPPDPATAEAFGPEADIASDFTPHDDGPPSVAQEGTAATGAHPDRAARAVPPRRPTLGFMLRHPAHWLALGFGSGLSPKAPGTVGTLWGWAGFLVLDHWLTPGQWALALVAGLLVGWWACTVTARHMGVSDPGSIVWDEIIAIWIVLWLLMPAGLAWQVAAFAVFRYFDAAKPGPVRWADGLFKSAPGAPIGARQGLGIMFDDLVAAGCTLLVLAVARQLLASLA